MSRTHARAHAHAAAPLPMPAAETLASQAREAPPISTMGGCLIRLCWMAIGNVVLVYSALFILQHDGAFLSAADAVFWAAVTFALVTRRVDIRRFHGQTVTSEPATMAHWRRYAAFMLGASLALWAVAHALGQWVV